MIENDPLVVNKPNDSIFSFVQLSTCCHKIQSSRSFVDNIEVRSVHMYTREVRNSMISITE